MVAEDPILLTLSDLSARLVPFEGHTWCILNLTFELDFATNVYLQRCDFLPKDRWHCGTHKQIKTQMLVESQKTLVKKKDRLETNGGMYNNGGKQVRSDCEGRK